MSTTSSREPPVPPRWREHRSEHFVFSFVSGFRVENAVMSVAARMEAVRDATAEALDLEELPDEPIRVYLLTYAPGKQDPEGGEGRRGYEMRDERVLVIRLSDAPGTALERALVELLLTSSLDVRVDRLLVDGVLGYVAQEIDDSDPTELNVALTRLQSEGRPISLAVVRLGSTGEAKLLYHQVVTSFVAFLITTYGPDAFKRFAREFDPNTPDRASEAAYSKSMADLEKEWLTSLRQTQPDGPGPSLRQAPGPSQPPAPGQMRPSTLDEPQPPAPGVMGFFRGAFSYLRPYWGKEALILLATVISAALGIVLPLAFGAAIDALTTGDYSYLRLLVLGLVALFIIEVPATLGQQYLSVNVAANVMKDMQYNMFSHLQRLSTDFYTRTRPGEITSRFTNDLGLMNMALTQTLPMMATLAVTFIGSLVSLFFLQGWLALMVVLVLPLLLILPARLGGRAARAVHETQRNRAMVASTIQENVGAQQVIKAYGLQKSTLGRFRDQLDRLNRSVVRGGFLSALPGITADISMSFIQLLSLTGGVILVYYNQLEVGALVSFQLLLGGVTAPMMSITSIYQMLLQSSVGMQRVNELLDERPQIVDAPDAKTLGRFSEEIRFEDVSFSYTGEQMNLRDANLTILAGQSVAFVGPSGSGKSTLLNLIMRFYDPNAGVVTVDGQDLRQVTQESLRGQIGTVFQDTFLYNTTVRENITLGKTDATEEDIEAAARAAEIHDFILTLPQGYDTEVGERGDQLSGGQRQRIALARAILYDPPILVLDEPTSALDSQTEAAVNATLHEQGQGRTVITVTHRLASVANADRIFVLERGQVVEQGIHEELLHAQGLYHRLWGQQNGFADAERVGVEASRLRAIPFFENLDETLLSALDERFVRERCVEGQTIFEEGDPGDKLYFVDRGEVEVLISTSTGEERRMALLRDGDYFGEIALLEDVHRTATVRTRVPSTLLVLDRERFLDLLRAAPDLRAAFERGVEERRQANLTVLKEAARVEGRL